MRIAIKRKNLPEIWHACVLFRFAGIEVYEYEQPENFEDDEEIDEDEAFNEGEYRGYLSSLHFVLFLQHVAV
jgi:hypothetical protein